MNKIYLITFNDVDYDEYRAILVIVENIKNINKIAEISKEKEMYDNRYEENIEEIKFIGYSKLKEQIVIKDFNQG